MNKINILIFGITGFVSHCFSQTATYGQVSILCPKMVTCASADPKSCQLSDNSYDFWDKPQLMNAITSIKGDYQLVFVSANNTNDDFNNTKRGVSCLYVGGQWEATRNFLLLLKHPAYNILRKLKKESSEWNDEGHCYPKSSSANTPIDSAKCPLVQAPGVAILDDTAIKLFYPNPNAYFEPNYIANKWISYTQLRSYCGATSSCIIDIGECDAENETCFAYGEVNLDISANNIVRINQINSFKTPGNSYVFKQKSSFNIIYSTPDTK